MKMKYVYDDEKYLVSSSQVVDDYMLLDNETFIAPNQGLNTPILFNGTSWEGAKNPEIELLGLPDNGPSTEMAALALTVAQNKADQDTVNAQLLLAMAKQTVKETN